MPPRKTIPARICQFPECSHRAVRNHAYCTEHRTTPAAIAFRKELRQAKSLLAEDLVDAEHEAEIAAKRAAFERRAKRGDFNKLIGSAMYSMFQQAEENAEFQREIGMLRYAMLKSIALEDDPHKMALTVARCANAIAKTTLTRHLTKEPDPESERPYWEYARPWRQPHDRESLVQYIWRHRPEDFEVRYMTRIDDVEVPATLDKRVLAEFESVDRDEVKIDDVGKFLSPPASDSLRAEVKQRTGISLPPNPEHDEEEGHAWLGRRMTNYVARSPEWWADPENANPDPIYMRDADETCAPAIQSEPEPDPEWDTASDYRTFLNRFPDPEVIDPSFAEPAEPIPEPPEFQPRLARGRR